MKKFLIIVVILIISAGGYYLKIANDAGQNKEIIPFIDRNWRVAHLTKERSAEDITIDQATGLAYFSTEARRLSMNGFTSPQGTIFMADLNADSLVLIDMLPNFNRPFHPHGIGLFHDVDDQVRIFAVNHNDDGDFVEIFEQEGQRLNHIRSVSGELMFSPNDVVPAGPESFYATNDHGWKSPFAKMVEDYAMLPLSYVVYYDGNSFHKVAEEIGYANGININADGSKVYVAATVGQEVLIYNRDFSSDSLILDQRLALNTGVDNIEVDADGSLWLGCHPKLLTFVAHAADASVPAPSEILHLTFSPAGVEIDTVLLDTGALISASSVAAHYQGKILIGGVFDPVFLYSDISGN